MKLCSDDCARNDVFCVCVSVCTSSNQLSQNKILLIIKSNATSIARPGIIVYIESVSVQRNPSEAVVMNGIVRP